MWLNPRGLEKRKRRFFFFKNISKEFWSPWGFLAKDRSLNGIICLLALEVEISRLRFEGILSLVFAFLAKRPEFWMMWFDLIILFYASE